MKTTSSLFAGLAIIGLAACASTESAQAQHVIYYVDTIQPIYHGAGRVVVTQTAGSDYQPHLAQEYRMGYWAGRQDASYGVRRDSVRAFRLSGGRWESYFQEGYADGYDGRPITH